MTQGCSDIEIRDRLGEIRERLAALEAKFDAYVIAHDKAAQIMRWTIGIMATVLAAIITVVGFVIAQH